VFGSRGILQTLSDFFGIFFPLPFIRMPTVNIPKLIEVLQESLDRLYAIYIECRNDELSEEIERVRARLSKVIKSLESVSYSFIDD
jgi:hypothetical protein